MTDPTNNALLTPQEFAALAKWHLAQLDLYMRWDCSDRVRFHMERARYFTEQAMAESIMPKENP